MAVLWAALIVTCSVASCYYNGPWVLAPVDDHPGADLKELAGHHA